jgi:hypothetical protein
MTAGTTFRLGLDDLLGELRRRRWTLVRWGEPDRPALLAAAFTWVAYWDVLILRSEEQASGYRAPRAEGLEAFNPEMVVYQYHQSPLWSLRAILALPVPGSPEAPTRLERPKHPECFISDDLPTPVVIRPLGVS